MIAEFMTGAGQSVDLDAAVKALTLWGRGRGVQSIPAERQDVQSEIKRKKQALTALALRSAPGNYTPEAARSFADFFTALDRDSTYARAGRNKLNAIGLQNDIDRMYRVTLLAQSLSTEPAS
jgi:hypothetical protein